MLPPHAAIHAEVPRHASRAGGCLAALRRWVSGLPGASAAGAAMGGAYLAEPSPGTALLLLGGMALAAWQFQQERRLRWTGLALTLAFWQLGSMGWITAVLAPDLAPLEHLAAAAVLLAVQWMISLGSLLLLAVVLLQLFPRRPALALPLAWWAWMVLRDLCWWGGGYGSLSLPLLSLPGLGALVPVLGPALFEALMWVTLLLATAPKGSAGVRCAAVAGLAAALGMPAWPAWTSTPPGAGVDVAVVTTPAVAAGVGTWDLQTRDASLAALHRTISEAAPGSLLVTPEIFLPEPPPRTAEGVWGDLLTALQARRQRLLLGTALPHPDMPEALMNAALLLTPTGDGMSTSIYAKQRLAPIGEELPWPRLLGPLAGRWLDHALRVNRQAGPVELAQPLLTGGAALGLLLCHEVAFGDQPAATADALVHLASDRWSGDPRSSRQALGLARLRSLESGKWLLSVTEGRPAQLIDPHGNVSAAQPLQALPLREGLTPFVRWRDLQHFATFAALALALLARRLRRSRASPPSFASVPP